MQVEIWSDVVCPWCYIGKRRFEQALAGFAHRDDVSRDLAQLPARPGHPEGLRRQCRRLPDQDPRLLPRAGAGHAVAGHRARGGGGARLPPQLEPYRAHRSTRTGCSTSPPSEELGDELKERLLRAYFTDGLPISDIDTLVELAVEVGLDPVEARTVLESDAYLDDVNADFAQARAYGINGVPFFVVDQKFGVSGAQAPEVFADLLDRAWAEANPLTMVGRRTPAGHQADASCEDGSCAV